MASYKKSKNEKADAPYEELKDVHLEEGFYFSNNIAELLTEGQCEALGMSLLAQIKTDISSRSDWLQRNDKWMELVTQVMEAKTYPWQDAANVKFPLISTAAVQFHARAFPALLGNNKPVKAKVIGPDKVNLKAERAQRVSTYMSYQVTDGMDNWMDDMDRLLFLVPIIGSLYKKTYYSEQKRQNVSDMIHPRDFIINYDALEIKDARKTHRLWKLPNTIKEMQLRGLYRELDEQTVIAPPKTHSKVRDATQGLNNPGIADDFSLQELYETHCLLDLDGDGYKEPYVCTMRASDGKVFRLVANYDDDNIEVLPTGDGDATKIVAIKPKDFFTHYYFLPDPESKTHGIGFGQMIGPINEAVNTILNMMIDAGHMHTLGGGFLSRGIRMKGGSVKFKPNEWKTINTTGDDLRKGILPLMTKEPSTVLFQLLGLLIDSGKDLASVQDLMVGRNPGQNQPYSTTREVMEQGMKVFNGIYKRLYRSMTSEFKKLYRLNSEHPDIQSYINVLDLAGEDASAAAQAPSLEEGEGGQLQPTGKPLGIEAVMEFLSKDFAEDDINIIPTAEPDMVAEMQKVGRANALLEKANQGIPLNMEEVTKRVLEAEGHENVGALMTIPDQGPPPDIKLEIDKFEWQKQIDSVNLEMDRIVKAAEVGKMNVEAELAWAEAQGLEVAGLHSQWLEQQKMQKEEFDSVTARLKVLIDGQNGRARKQAEGKTGQTK